MAGGYRRSAAQPGAFGWWFTVHPNLLSMEHYWLYLFVTWFGERMVVIWNTPSHICRGLRLLVRVISSVLLGQKSSIYHGRFWVDQIIITCTVLDPLDDHSGDVMWTQNNCWPNSRARCALNHSHGLSLERVWVTVPVFQAHCVAELSTNPRY
jgi:hypothetical protein